MERYLAPWAAINKLKEYHGDISAEEKYEILSGEQKGTYILTDYNPDDPENQFKITMLAKEPRTVRSTYATSFTIRPGKIYHTIKPNAAHLSHLNAVCNFSDHFEIPVWRKGPRSLKEIARAAICERHTYKDIENLAKERIINEEVKKFIMQKSSTVKHTLRTMLVCDVYDFNHL